MDKKSQFVKVITAHEALIYKITTLYTNTEQDKHDLFQEIIYQLWKSFDSFNAQSKVSTWMYRVALNTAIYNLKQSRKRIQTASIDYYATQFAEDTDRAQEERVQLLYEHIQRLNLLEKGIMLLYLEGKSHEEIAGIVGISISNVGTRMSRIREKLKSQLIKKQ